MRSDLWINILCIQKNKNMKESHIDYRLNSITNQ